MTAEWPLQGNSCMQDCRSLVGEYAVPAPVGGSAGAALPSLCWAAPLFYCFLFAKETNIFFALAQNSK